MITFRHHGNFSRTEKFFDKLLRAINLGILDKYGRLGVDALSKATPIDTGLASKSWYYKIHYDRKGATVTWCNSDIENGFPVAIALQYGHGTRNGGYVQGRDYINPAMRVIFDALAKDAWEEVTNI